MKALRSTFTVNDSDTTDASERVPLWSVTHWDKRFNSVDRDKQGVILCYRHLLASELEGMAVCGGDIKLLMTYPADLWTTEERAGGLVSEGEIVAIPGGGNANIQYYKGKFISADNRIAASSDTEKLDTKYLYYFMVANQPVIDSYYRGVSIKHPEMARILNMQIPLPRIHRQHAIVEILDKICELKRNTVARLEKLNVLDKALFVELFGDLVINEKGWQYIPLGKVCDVRDGTHASPKFQSTGYPLMTSKNFTSGFEDFSGAKLISKVDFDEINRRSRVDPGDIVMPMIGTIGCPVIIKETRPFAIKNVSLIKFVKGSPLNIFVKAVLSSQYFQRIVEDKNRGNTQKFIALGDIRGLEIPTPPIALQFAFAERIERIDKVKATLRETIAKLDALYRAKLQEYFG